MRQRNVTKIIVFSYFLFTMSLFFMIALKMFPPEYLVQKKGNTVLLDLYNDEYYIYLIPLTIPSFVIFIYVNWLSLKFFRHN